MVNEDSFQEDEPQLSINSVIVEKTEFTAFVGPTGRQNQRSKEQ